MRKMGNRVSSLSLTEQINEKILLYFEYLGQTRYSSYFPGQKVELDTAIDLSNRFKAALKLDTDIALMESLVSTTCVDIVLHFSRLHSLGSDSERARNKCVSLVKEISMLICKLLAEKRALRPQVTFGQPQGFDVLHSVPPQNPAFVQHASAPPKQ